MCSCWRSRCWRGPIPLAAAPPKRKPLGPNEREAVLALIKAVDLAQANDAGSDPDLTWDHHILKSANYTGYVPFTLTPARAYKATAMYVRAVSRHDGMRSSSEHSYLREWLLNNRDVMPRQSETVYVNIGEMPLAGIAGGSSRTATAAAAAASALLTQQVKDLEKAQPRRERGQAKGGSHASSIRCCFRSRSISSWSWGARTRVERALALPPGEYDVYVGLIDRAKIKTSSPAIMRQTVTVPDFWSDQLALSSLILARDVRALKAAFAAPQQAEHPYAFGSAEVIPASGATFTTDEALTVVYQMCNYGAPDSDVTRQLHVLPPRRRPASVQPDRHAAVLGRRFAAGWRLGVAGIRVADRAAPAVPAGAVRAGGAGARPADAGDRKGDRGIHGRLWVKIGIRPVGAWLSLVEHSVRDRGVGGSNPLAPTNKFSIEIGLRSTVIVG